MQIDSREEVTRIARRSGAEDKARTFSTWSHVVSLLHPQLSRGIGLNDLCDSLQLHSGPLSTLGATPPSRNGVSNTNRERPAELAEQLFWSVLDHLGTLSPEFVAGRTRGRASRFKMPIHVVDTTVLELVANNMDWVKHRRRARQRSSVRSARESRAAESWFQGQKLQFAELCDGRKKNRIKRFHPSCKFPVLVFPSCRKPPAGSVTVKFSAQRRRFPTPASDWMRHVKT